MPDIRWSLNKYPPISGKETTAIRATGAQTRKPFCGPQQCQLRGHEVLHEFLYLPDCPVPVRGRELLPRWGVQISFSVDGSDQLKLKDRPPL